MAGISAGALGTILGNPAQAAQGILSGGLTQHMYAQRSAAGKATVMLGLATRFEVMIGSKKLGLWSSCTGLAVDFEPEAAPVGGDPTGQYWLPGRLTYPALVLERAMHPETSQDLQDWLVETVRSWADGIGDVNRTARIRLLDAAGAEVATWVFYGVRPASWKGPDLKSGQAAVAVEKLTLYHEGFLDELHANPEMASLSLNGVKVEFPYNPASVSVSLGGDSTGSKAPATPGAPASPTPPPAAIVPAAIPKGLVLGMTVVLAGRGVAHDVQNLIGFGRQRQKDKKAVFPEITFSWGKTRLKVTLRSVSFDLTHFDGDGQPIRATAKLTLQTIDDKLYPDAVKSGSTRTTLREPDWREAALNARRDDPMRYSAGQKR